MNRLRKRRAVLLQTQNNIINIMRWIWPHSKDGCSAYTQVIITTRVKMVDEQQRKEGIEPSNMQNSYNMRLS